MNNLLVKLGLDDNKTDLNDGAKHTFDLTSSNKYQKLVEILDKDDDFEIKSDSVMVVDTENNITFQNADYVITLVANFDNDTYSCIIETIKE